MCCVFLCALVGGYTDCKNMHGMNIISGFSSFFLFALFRHDLMFVGAFAKLRKATVSFVMSVRPSVRPHGTTLMQLDGFS